MTERERERMYWRVTVALLAASPAVAYVVSWIPEPPLFSPLHYIGALVASLPTPIVTELVVQAARGRLPGVWLDQPSVRIAHSAAGDVDETVEMVLGRLGQFGFETHQERDGDAIEIAFSRGKAPGGVHAMADHAFSGVARVAPSAYGARVETDLVLHDTLIVESGELSMIDSLGGYVTGRDSEIDVATAPYTTLCAVNLSWIATGLAVAAGLGVGPGPGWAAAAATAAASMAAVMLGYGAIRGPVLLGRRLCLAAIALAAIPWLVWLAAHALR